MAFTLNMKMSQTLGFFIENILMKNMKTIQELKNKKKKKD